MEDQRPFPISQRSAEELLGDALPQEARRLIEMLEGGGYESWVVGGFVRDVLLGREGHDVDVATAAPWQEVRRIAEGAGLRVHETGVRFGGVTVSFPEGWEGRGTGEAGVAAIEVTTFRTDGPSADGRHPDRIDQAASIEEDLARRDFTMNALAFHPGRGLIDPYGGLEALAAQAIKAVGDPRVRFKEDALRILRACRFASQLGFRLAPATYEAMVQGKGGLAGMSTEHISHELDRLVLGEHIHDALMGTVDGLAFVLPELVAMKGCPQRTPYHIYDVLEHTAFAMERMPPTRLGRWAALFHDMGKPAAAFIGPDGREHFYAHAQVSMALARGVMGRMQMSQGFQKKVLALVEHHDDAMEPTARSVKRMLARLGGDAELLRTLCHLKRADALAQAPFCAERAVLAEELEAILDDILAEGAAFSIRDLAISGRDLIGCGVPKGPRVGALLEEALEAVVDERVANEREALIELLGL